MNKILLLIFAAVILLKAQEQIINIPDRSTTSLNGEWSIIIDPYESGYYNYRYEENLSGYFRNAKPSSKSDLIEYDFDKADRLNVPGDWNTQRKDLFFYEGTVWYKKSFSWSKKKDKRIFIHFGAVNYSAKVYVNGEKIGEHTGGFVPFNFEITEVLKDGDNFVVVKADNKRLREGVPTLNTDWWNYGGITRDVNIVELPEEFIQDYFIQLAPALSNRIEGWVKLNGVHSAIPVKVKIPEIGIEKVYFTNSEGYCKFSFDADPILWSPQQPKLYDVIVESDSDRVVDQIGFRTIEVKGTDILVNSKPVFLRGISMHEESPVREGRAFTQRDAELLLNSAQELGCNFVRLAHYPHSEYMVRTADKMGILLWSEIPVYWTILWENKDTYALAAHYLKENIIRDKNRASVIIWSVANETPRSPQRLKFLTQLISQARSMDPTRLISAATELSFKGRLIEVDDTLSESLDVIGANEYLGWYSASVSDINDFSWRSSFQKPVIITEFGGGALFGLHGDEQTRWTEEYQNAIYREQLKMLSRAEFIKGMSPWILYDFRSPRRPLPGIQDYFNRKGIISKEGGKKMAFYTLQRYYREKKNN